MIQTTLGALADAERALPAICALKLSAKSAYHLQKLARLVAAETKHFHTERDSLIRELGTPKDNGQIEILPTSANFAAFATRIQELGAVPIEIAWAPISLDLIGDEKVSAADLLALGPLFQEPDA